MKTKTQKKTEKNKHKNREQVIYFSKLLSFKMSCNIFLPR